ncbi:hypothetical protein POREN0001_0286 [Porphyromonas endodontalis ATCC 35406]|uniref:Uncharacterized protein n=1 Tax=Porphyromonas endodontalis (strain ATCC 35406 / DSM 24491 / JCM 8526 / CCUG 16442 / BCRC 14492 / NCTC 13058 / HG 370) TaxID=553175 RepID=C3JAP8_POREA|nr:hypothetical protein POREN0001_0286 [Porphyromonas endodontalis ATCC 35406]
MLYQLSYFRRRETFKEGDALYIATAKVMQINSSDQILSKISRNKRGCAAA